MMLIELKAKIKGTKYLPFEQDGKTYNLYDMPKGFVIKGNLDLSNKSLTELPDLSEVVVKGSFNCNTNQLTSLEGAPKEVGEDFDCRYNNLTSLEGAPKEVGRSFYCNGNNLTTLEGAPQTVGGGFRCYYNQLTSLVGLPLMKKSMRIYCDGSLGNKYGFSTMASYEKLCESPLYRSEDAMNRVRNKLPQEKIETKPASKKQQEAFEKINAEFSQWLKDNSAKPTRE